MICPTCGLPMLIPIEREPSDISEAMNEQRRVRVCPNSHRTDTVEITRAELQSLRTRAYMGDRVE